MDPYDDEHDKYRPFGFLICLVAGASMLAVLYFIFT
jgi:hypothetical protein